MAHARIRNASSEFLSVSETAQRLGVGLSTARKIATESNSWIIFSERCKRIDIKKATAYAREKYGQQA